MLRPSNLRYGQYLVWHAVLLGLGVTAALVAGTPAFAEDSWQESLFEADEPDRRVQAVANPPEEAGALSFESVAFHISSEPPSADGSLPDLNIVLTPPAPAPIEMAQAPPAEPADRQPPEVTILTERGGVLTPRGVVVLEPAIEYTKATTDRLNFRGIQIVEGFLIGVIEATDADRDTVTASLTGRWGVTDRLELEAKVPFVYREDDVTTLFGGLGGSTSTDSLDSSGLGDVEAAVHYQINDGREGWPFFIANLRYKSNTGEGAFDIDRDSDGVPTELATGSGFHSIEPSLTVIYPTDPAVLFANVDYVFTLEDDVDETIGSGPDERLIGDVDPGDSFGFTFGIGFALNEQLSLSLGYQHDFIFETETEVTNVSTGVTTTVDSEEFSVGSMLIGGSFQLNDRVGISVTTQIGATEDAPDAQITLRIPIRLN